MKFPSSPDYILRCVDGVYDNRQIRLKEIGEEITIGSADDDSVNFSIKDIEISPTHCKLISIPKSIYYTLEDLESVNGTWKKLSFFEDGMEITETTEFRIFQNAFVFEKLDNEKNEFILKFTEGNINLSRTIDDNLDGFEIGKRDCLYEVSMPLGNENHMLRVQKLNGRLIVTYVTSDITNEGFFYRLKNQQKTLMRAEDCFKSSTIEYVSCWSLFSQISENTPQL